MVWYGMVWYGMVRYGMVWYGMVWYVHSKLVASLSTRCVRNRLVASLSTSCNNAVILSSCYKIVTHYFTRKNAQVVTGLQTSCCKSVQKLSSVDKLCSHCLFPGVVTSLEQAVN